MSANSIVNLLYGELLVAAIIVLVIQLYNNITLYKMKTNRLITIMLVFSIVICVTELLWNIFEGHSSLKSLSFANAAFYSISNILMAAVFNKFFLEVFGITWKNKVPEIVFYFLPALSVTLLCATTQWTKLIFWVDDGGVVRYGPFFEALLRSLALLYIISVSLLAIYFAVKEQGTGSIRSKVSRHLIIFSVLTLGMYLVQDFVFQDTAEDYIILSIVWAVALGYLTTTVNTELLVNQQAQIDAVESDLRIASKIQMDALPDPEPSFDDFSDCKLVAAMHTAREVGGDFYDYFPIDDHRLCFLIADVSGKGTPAALFMMTVKTMIKDHAFLIPDTGEIFTTVNRLISENNDSCMFATAWIGIYDKETQVLQFTNAGHNYPLLMRDGRCEEIHKVHGLILGCLDDTVYEKDEIVLNKGDRLLLYTDGITEAHNQGDELYGEARLKTVFDENGTADGDKLLSDILESVNEFAGETPQFDDMTMMIFTV